MKQYLKDNKTLLIKYFLIILTNLLIFIISDFYFKDPSIKYVLMFLIIIIFDMLITYYKGKTKFKYALDLIADFIVGLIFIVLFFSNEDLPSILAFVFFANNIVFMRSRLSDGFFKSSLQYLLIPIITIFNLFVSLVIIYFV